VAENNVITKGDFVSVVRDTGYRTLTDSQYLVMYKKNYDVVNKKTLLVVYGNNAFYAMVLQKTSDGVRIINQTLLNIVGIDSSSFIKFDFNIHNNTLYYILPVASSSEHYCVIYGYKFINGEFVAQTPINLPNKPNDSIYGFSVFGSNEDIAIFHSNSNSSLYFRVYSKNSNDEYVYTLTDVNGITNFNFDQKVFFTASGDNCVILVARSNQSGSSGYHAVKFYNYSPTNATIDKLEINTNGAFYDGFDAQVVGDKLYFVGDVKYSVSGSGSPYWYKPKVGIVDISSDNLILEYLNEFQTAKPSWSYWWVDYGDENNLLIQGFSGYKTATYGVGMSGYIVLTKDSQGVFTSLIAEYQDINNPQAGMTSFMDGDEIKVVDFTSGSPNIGVVEYTLTVTENEILIGQPTNYVKAYDNKSAIGFAKTSGTAGDTIQVYVPVSST
jgi:hypothetical protein